MSNFWGAINAIRREATKLRTDVYSAGCFTAQEAAMDLDRAAAVLDAAGKVDKELRTKQVLREIGRCEENGHGELGDILNDFRALLSALPDEVKK